MNAPLLGAATTGGVTAAFDTLRDGGTAFPSLSGKVSVFGNPGGPFELVFDNNNLPLANSGFAADPQYGRVIPTVRAAVTGNERHRLTFTGDPTGGTFTLAYTASNTSNPTATTTVNYAGAATARNSGATGGHVRGARRAPFK